MKYSTPEIEALWSEEAMNDRWDRLWKLHGDTCTNEPPGSCELTFDEKAKMVEIMNSSTHEVVRRMYQGILDGRLDPDCHLGLTSSDITDNARMIACDETAQMIQKEIDRLQSAIVTLGQEYKPEETLAYTHLLPAKIVGCSDYTDTWKALLDSAKKRGQFTIRGFRGSVGLGHKWFPKIDQFLETSNEKLRAGQAHDMGNLNYLIVPLEPKFMLQNWSPVSALEVTGYLARVAVVLTKIANDVRLLVALGRMIPAAQTTASSTLLHKKGNPTSVERVVGLMRMVKNGCRAIEDSLFEQMLSRTLDDSSVMREELPRAWGHIHLAIKELTKVMGSYAFVVDPYVVAEFGDEEDAMFHEIGRTGCNRIQAELQHRQA